MTIFILTAVMGFTFGAIVSLIIASLTVRVVIDPPAYAVTYDSPIAGHKTLVFSRIENGEVVTYTFVITPKGEVKPWLIQRKPA